MTDDHKLKQDVLAELAWEPSVVSDHIGVTAKDGVVTLTGHVDTFSQKLAAEKAAGRVKGVKALAEEIEVRLPVHIKHGDDEIAAAALNRIGWDVSVPKDAVKVRVEKGYVTLTGQLDHHYQSDAAAWDVRPLMGVTGVSNQITIKPHPDSAKIAEQIRHAMKRSWFDDDEVKVTATGGAIHLTGTVESWRDREIAGETAWAAPGATTVTNDIRVS